ncbi:tetratricopeptide repeat protein [Oxalobacteraceae bacterium]|nr:tetratricopeptide repeat protein [Oxalobacteraceae bacterium]
MKPSHTLLALGLGLCGAAFYAPAHADCGRLQKLESGGDYTNPADRDRLTVVEQYHFTPDVERLVRGASDSVGGDLSYTLEHFPNHHRALAAMAKLALRSKTSQPRGARYSIECYFDRALRLRPDDARVHSLFGGYLLAINQTDNALEQLRKAAALEPDNATAQYNLGLLYVRQKDYPNARKAAQKAYENGFPLLGLKKKLQDAGQWQEAPQQTPGGAAQ